MCFVFRHGPGSRLGEVVREKVTTFIRVDAVIAPLLILCRPSLLVRLDGLREDGGVMRWSVILYHDLVERGQLGITSHLRRLAHRDEAAAGVLRILGAILILHHAYAVKDDLGCD